MLLALCSCDAGERAADFFKSAASEAKLIWNELDEIAEFVFHRADRDKAATAALEAEAEIFGDTPIVSHSVHIEIVESPYNNAERTVIFSTGGVDCSDKTGTLTEAEARGYTRIERFEDASLDCVGDLLRAAGVEFEVRFERNPAPAGDVFALVFAGTSDSEAYYINARAPLTLYVSDEKLVMKSKGEKKTVYLTYDDGPSEISTVELLDVLDTYGVKATFFAIGDFVKKYPEAARQIADRGHTLSCHSLTHDYSKIYSSGYALSTEVIEWEKAVAEVGITLESKLFRFPGGSTSGYISDWLRSDMMTRLENMGYTVYDWNVVTNDALLYIKDEDESVYDYIRRNLVETFEQELNAKGDSNEPVIILMHESVRETVELMPWIIEYLMNNGYAFGELDELGTSWTFADRK